VTSLEQDIDSMKPKIEYLKQRIEQIEAIMNRSSTAVYNSYVTTHNKLAAQEREIVSRYNAAVAEYNQTHVGVQTMLDISGGIGLEPEKFKVTPRETSPELEATKRVAQADSPVSEINGEEWVKSNPSAVETSPKPKLKLNRPWKTPETHVLGNADYFTSSTASGESYWRTAEKGTSWHDQLNSSSGCTERYFDDASRTLQVARFENNNFINCVSAKNIGGMVVFTKSDKSIISVPTQPPHWWN